MSEALDCANIEKLCQAFSSLGIVFRKCLMVRRQTRNQKSAFDKMVVFS